MVYFSSLSKDRAPERRFLAYIGLVAFIVVLSFVMEVADWANLYQDFINQTEVLLQFALLCVVGAAAPQFMREMRRRRTAALEAEESTHQLELLFKMTDMLQSALGHADANAVLRSTASSLMPGFGGALYIFNNSGDRLELSTSWHWPEAAPLNDVISPSDCWAIKRGKPHLNLSEANALCCDHHQSGLATMEIPMMARGEVYGLLLIERDSDSAPDLLRTMASVASALADAMSLAISNLTLRERLRTQALRDALTGLYNRRYMEDALERCADQASRADSPLSIVMIDLDHFKKLNDEHGHAMGDAVLAETAAAILAAIRPCDIACRYGGEEMAVILPDCSLEDAAARAELLRSRIERLSDRHGIPISASFGVSTISETSNVATAMSDADQALYQAKQGGRNRVITAPQSMRDSAGEPAAKAA